MAEFISGSLRYKEARHINAFKRQELHLLIDAVGIAREAAVRADDAVAGNDDGDRVVPDSAADGLGGHAGGLLAGDRFGDLAVCHRLSVGNREKDVPDLFAERRGFRCERRQKVRLFAAEVNVEPAASFLEYGEAFLLVCIFKRGGEILLPVEPKSDEGCAVTGERDGTERRSVMRCVLHGDASFRMVKFRC